MQMKTFPIYLLNGGNLNSSTLQKIKRAHDVTQYNGCGVYTDTYIVRTNTLITIVLLFI